MSLCSTCLKCDRIWHDRGPRNRTLVGARLPQLWTSEFASSFMLVGYGRALPGQPSLSGVDSRGRWPPTPGPKKRRSLQAPRRGALTARDTAKGEAQEGCSRQSCWVSFDASRGPALNAQAVPRHCEACGTLSQGSRRMRTRTDQGGDGVDRQRVSWSQRLQARFRAVSEGGFTNPKHLAPLSRTRPNSINSTVPPA
jgi:hypothetical protein